MTFKLIQTIYGLTNCVRISKFNRLIVIQLKRFSFETLAHQIKNVHTEFDKITYYPSKELVLKGILNEDTIKTSTNLFLVNKEALNVQDIELFYSISKKKDNDTTNKIRERILENICHVPQSFKEDDIYGEKWIEMKQKWEGIFQSNISSVIRKAGRCYNYDFLVSLESGQQVKVEFKHNCSRISELPQILSLSSSSDILPVSYAEYYYNNYLEKVKTCLGVNDTISKEEYMRYIHTINYSSHSIFSNMKEKDNSNEERDKLVNESISNFLKENSDKLIYKNLAEKLYKALDKMYVMWDVDTKTFFTEDMTDDLSSLCFSHIKNNNTLVVSTIKYNYMLLLRWRNHKGIMNPAWQISVKQK